MGIKIESIDFSMAEDKLRNLADDETMIEIHNTLGKFLEPYVPMDEGILAGSTVATPDYLKYEGSYAGYQYRGLVYGPNIPIVENGVVVGWFSPPGKAKHPTGERINYSTEGHPLATHHWDKAAMQDKGDVFVEDVEDILKRRLKDG